MKTITLELTEVQFAHLTKAAESRNETPAGLVKVRLFDLLHGPTDPFDLRGRLDRDREEEFLRRLA